MSKRAIGALSLASAPFGRQEPVSALYWDVFQRKPHCSPFHPVAGSPRGRLCPRSQCGGAAEERASGFLRPSEVRWTLISFP